MVKLGQNFLIDKNIVNKILRHAELNPLDTVLEIGCGHGILTQALCSYVAKLVVVECDAFCLEKTKQLLSSSRTIEFYLKDILTFDFSCLKESNIRVIANIPYYISSPILKYLLKYRDYISRIDIMVQKEFGDKLLALKNTKSYTSLSVYMQSHFDIKKQFLVSKSCFFPQPSVDSMVVTLIPKQGVVLPDLFFDMVRALFWGRRKSIRRILRSNPYVSLLAVIDEQNSPISLDKRGESLSLEELSVLYAFLSSYLISAKAFD